MGNSKNSLSSHLSEVVVLSRLIRYSASSTKMMACSEGHTAIGDITAEDVTMGRDKGSEIEIIKITCFTLVPGVCSGPVYFRMNWID